MAIEPIRSGSGEIWATRAIGQYLRRLSCKFLIIVTCSLIVPSYYTMAAQPAQILGTVFERPTNASAKGSERSIASPSIKQTRTNRDMPVCTSVDLDTSMLTSTMRDQPQVALSMSLAQGVAAAFRRSRLNDQVTYPAYDSWHCKGKITNSISLSFTRDKTGNPFSVRFQAIIYGHRITHSENVDPEKKLINAKQVATGDEDPILKAIFVSLADKSQEYVSLFQRLNPR